MTFVPREPPLTPWDIPEPDNAEDDLVAIGADLAPGTLLMAYRRGLFPMPLGQLQTGTIGSGAPLGWWSPNPRAILELDNLRISRSLRKSLNRFEIRIDSAFSEVMAACGDPSRDHGWIDQDVLDAYQALFDLGWVHSIEAWDPKTNTLAGGLYGVAIGGLFAGESMFHRQTDASKVALVALVAVLRETGHDLLDVQWQTDHLTTLGVTEISRQEYLDRLRSALALTPKPFSALEQPFGVKVGAPLGETGRWSTPLQIIDIGK